MDGNDGACSVGKALARALRIEREGTEVDICQHRFGSGSFNGADRGHGCMRHRDDLIPVTDATGEQSQLDRVGAGGDAYRMGNTMIFGEFPFEGLDLGSQDVPATISDAPHCHGDLTRKLVVERLQLIEGYHVFRLTRLCCAYYSGSSEMTYLKCVMVKSAPRFRLYRRHRACQRRSRGTIGQ